SWRSPIAGSVRITGRVADADPVGGNGISWSIETRNAAGARPLASGEFPNGGEQHYAQGKYAERLTTVEVRPGDRVDLVVGPKGEYGFDPTTVELIISSWDGSAVWDLPRDCVADLLAGNPHADRLGNGDVWWFGDAPGSRSGGSALEAALTPWREAVANRA